MDPSYEFEALLFVVRNSGLEEYWICPKLSVEEWSIPKYLEMQIIIKRMQHNAIQHLYNNNQKKKIILFRASVWHLLVGKQKYSVINC
jgi:hypothetical protein